jgi:ferric-dicitrate binding protein FerR (iron transport regulator)
VYFDVARDKNKPFIVNFSNHKVKVLGTEFNVKAYEEEEYQHVTLVEGSVSIEDSAALVTLKPNQQVVMNNVRNEFSVKQVNTDFYTAWKNDLFMYRKEKLGSIVRDMQRQYDMKIFYESQKLKEKTFSMRVSKPKSFQEILEYMSATDKVSFEIKDNTVIVKKGTRW